MEKIIEVKNLAISFKTQYGILKAVRGVSFDLYRGETLAIVGESGSGKSVTSRAIMGLLAGNAIYESGSIMYGGRDLMSIPEEMFHEIRGSKISMIFQDPMSSLNPIQTVGKQISEALIFKMGMTKEMAKRKAIELMEQVGIPNAENGANRYRSNFRRNETKNRYFHCSCQQCEVIICDETDNRPGRYDSRPNFGTVG